VSAPRCTRGILAGGLLLAASACDTASPDVTAPVVAAAGVPGSCLGPSNKIETLIECVTISGVRDHQAALQAIADANGGRRSVGGPGHDASVQYVAGLLTGAGYSVRIQPFQINAFVQLGPSVLQAISPTPATYVEGTDYSLFQHTAAGDVTASVTAVDLNPGGVSTSGCEAADFAGFPAGNIALMQRGTCTFLIKAQNAAAAGAVGAIIFNAYNLAGLVGGTLTPSYAGNIPVVGTTYNRGVEWAATPGLTMRIKADVLRGLVTTENVIAESVEGDPNNVVMLGGHLDSVNQGPGINDNGSGAAAILETALQMAGAKTRNRMRFAFWSAQEQGSAGSQYYVDNLSLAELSAIALYLDVHMIGSPNYVRFVLDGDGSDSGSPGPAGSGAIESFFRDFYSGRGLASQAAPLQITAGDQGPFLLSGVPVGGVFTGATGIKSASQAAVYGGTAGFPYDPCYHLACDTFANVSLDVLDLNSDAVAAAALAFGMNTEAVNGVKGKGRFKGKKVPPPPSLPVL
jgi:aminopeptidase Y